MNLDKYDFLISETFLDFEFDSIGPNGVIKKVVRYSPQNANGVTYFNLAFGDLDEITGRINDIVVSDNKDTDKILATIAATVLEFSEQFPDVMIHAQGSTSSRTRLYQIGISANWEQIKEILDVYGFIDDNWEAFKKNRNYEAFIAIRKKA